MKKGNKNKLQIGMSKYLQLTEAQKTEIMKIHQNAFEKMDIARQQFANDKPMMKKARKEIFETRKTELQKILTKEQFDTYVAKQKEEHEKMKKEKEARKAAHEKRKAEKVPAPTPNNGGSEPKK